MFTPCLLNFTIISSDVLGVKPTRNAFFVPCIPDDYFVKKNKNCEVEHYDSHPVVQIGKRQLATAQLFRATVL